MFNSDAFQGIIMERKAFYATNFMIKQGFLHQLMILI